MGTRKVTQQKICTNQQAKIMHLAPRKIMHNMVSFQDKKIIHIAATCKTHHVKILYVKINGTLGRVCSKQVLRAQKYAKYFIFIYLFGVLQRFQHCTGHITMGSWKGNGNQYFQFIRVLYCKLLTNGKQLPAFPFEAVLGTEPRPQRWEARVLPLCHHGRYPSTLSKRT